MSETKNVVLDFSECKYIGSLHKVIKENLELPDWYGNNLDALWDAITGLMEVPVKIKIVYYPKSSDTKKMKTYVNEIISVFREAEIEYHEIELKVDSE